MTFEDLEAEVEQIATLVRERRFELALILTETLQARLDAVPLDDPTITPAVRELIDASRQLTESLITLRTYQMH